MVLRSEILGAEHPESLRTMMLAGRLAERQRDPARAAQLYQAVWQARSVKFGPDHPATREAADSLEHLDRRQ